MSGLIGALRVTLGMDSAAFTQGMTKAQREAAKSSSAIQKSLGGIKMGLAGLGVGISAGLFLGAARSALQFADDLDKAATQAGISVTRYQTLKEALRTLELSTEQTDKILKTFQATLGDVQNGVENGATKVLDRMGISTRIMSGEIKTADQLLDAFAGGAKGAGSQAQFVAYSVDTLGKKLGIDFAAAVGDGGDSLHKFEADFLATGRVIDEEMIQKLADANEAIDRFSSNATNQLTIFTANAIFGLEAVGHILDILALKLNNFGSQSIALAGVKMLLPDSRGAENTQGRVDRHNKARGPKAADSAADAIIRARAGKKPPGGGKRGKSAEQVERDRLRDAYEFASEERRAQIGILRGQQDLLTDFVDRNAVSRQIADLEHEQERAALAHAVQMGDKTQAQASILLALAAQSAALEKQAINQQEEIARQESYSRLEAVDYELQQSILDGQAALAETASERKAVELRILDLAYKEELERQSRLHTEAQARGDWEGAEEARRRLVAMGGQYSNSKRQVERRNMGPLESYLAGLPDTAAKADEALRAVAANGLQNIEDGLVGILAGTKSLAEGFREMTASIVADLIRIQIRKAIVGALGGALGGLFGGSGRLSLGDGFSTAVGNPGATNLGALAGLPKFAKGGSFTLGGMAGLDTNLLSLNGQGIAAVSRGEHVAISPNNEGRRGMYFDLRGAVMTQDLLAQMSRIGNVSSYTGAAMGSAGAQSAMARRSARRIP